MSAIKGKRQHHRLPTREKEVPLGRRVVPPIPPPEVAAPADPRTAFIQRLMLLGLPLGQVVEQAVVSLGLDRKASRAIYERVRDSIVRNLDQELSSARALTRERLMRDLANMRNPPPLRAPHNGEVLTEAILDAAGQPTKQRRPIAAAVDYHHVVAHERLLANIEGTLRPTEVVVDVVASQRRSLAALVSSLSEEELDQLEDEQRQLEESAGGAPG